MFRRIVTLGILSGLMLAAIAVGPALAATPTWAASQVATGAPNSIAVSGDRIAWQDQMASPRTQWTWKMGTAPLLLLTQYMWTPPVVSGDRVAWICTGGSQPFRVYTWKAGDASPTAVTSSTTGIPDDIQVSGDRLVWQLDYQWIVTWKVGDSQLTTLNVGAFQASGARVSGDRVVWYESNGSAYQIATWKYGEEPSRWITSGSLTNIEPAVSGDRIAWLQETGAGDEWAVMTQLASETVPAMVMVNSTYYTEGPVVSGDRIAWRQKPGGSDAHQVFTWHAGDASAAQVSHADVSQAYVGVSGDRLVWTGYQNVMTWAAGDATASVVATGHGPWNTKVSGDRVVWLNEGRVMTAVLLSPTTLGRPTISPMAPTHNKHAHFYSVLTPGSARIAAGATTTLKLYRKETRYVTKKVNGVNKRVKESYWHLRHSVKMTGTGTGVTVKLTATVTPKYAGSWKAVAVYGGASAFAGSTSPTKYFTVK
jgi:hypothetical protein